MNHLAHLYLASPGTESLIGNLAGDFVKGKLGDRFTNGVRAGIIQHRRIDAFTDGHPAVAAFRRVLVPEHGHYARVIADMFFDHFLAVRFEELAGETLDSFLARTFTQIDLRADLLPGRLQSLYPYIRDDRWLQSYASVESIASALQQISFRFTREPRLETAARHLVDSRPLLERHFDEFFPDVVAFAGAMVERD